MLYSFEGGFCCPSYHVSTKWVSITYKDCQRIHLHQDTHIPLTRNSHLPKVHVYHDQQSRAHVHEAGWYGVPDPDPQDRSRPHDDEYVASPPFIPSNYTTFIAAPWNMIPDEPAFETIKTAIELVPVDQKLLINSGEFYGRNPWEANLHLVARFFVKYPELGDRVFLSVKV
jgi:hypothetical protein